MRESSSLCHMRCKCKRRAENFHYIFVRDFVTEFSATEYGHLDIVKYLYETCHADVETKDKDGFTPINYASSNGHLEVVKYLYETCHAKITKETIENTKTNEIKEYLNAHVIGFH